VEGLAYRASRSFVTGRTTRPYLERPKKPSQAEGEKNQNVETAPLELSRKWKPLAKRARYLQKLYDRKGPSGDRSRLFLEMKRICQRMVRVSCFGSRNPSNVRRVKLVYEELKSVATRCRWNFPNQEEQEFFKDIVSAIFKKSGLS